MSILNLDAFRLSHPDPTFEDDFTNLNHWNTSIGASPSGAGEANGSFTANSVTLVTGGLQLRLTQNSVCSLGGEVYSANSYGAGLYEYTMRMGSMSTTPTGAGNSVSGGISSGFTFYNNSETEIDCIEAEGNFPFAAEQTTWNTLSHSQSSVRYFQNLSQQFHTYQFLWQPGIAVQYYLDNLFLATHTNNVPTHAAPIFLNHWGTNSAGFGGLRTNGVQRYLYISRVAFYEL